MLNLKIPKENANMKIPATIPHLFFDPVARERQGEMKLKNEIIKKEIIPTKTIIGKSIKTKERKSTPKIKPKHIEKNILSFI